MAKIVNSISTKLMNIGRRLKPGSEILAKSGARDADWYNRAFSQVIDYRAHYTESNYYFLWSVLADRILRAHLDNILDLGCGPGQFAALLHDRGVKVFRGVDFSSISIDMARNRCPYFEFIVADLEKSDILKTSDYNCIVTLEFLEHVEFDIDVIENIKSGTKFFATVPNFPYESHVRHFINTSEVTARYQRFFADFTVDSLIENSQGKTFYLMEGRRL